jgi:Uma2 family endonuclease
MVVRPNQQNQVAGDPYRFDVDEYHKMGEVGIFNEDSHVELLDGIVYWSGRPYKFDVDEYHKMAVAGIFDEDSRVELLGGEVFAMAPIGSRHAATVDRLNVLLIRQLGDRGIVHPQNPVSLSERSEPQPDISVLKPRADYYASGHPTPADVLLIVEVADTSLAYDRGPKLALYARWGIPEVWIVDLAGEVVTVYAKPSGRSYQSTRELKRGEGLSPAAFPDVDLSVEEILGRAQQPASGQ